MICVDTVPYMREVESFYGNELPRLLGLVEDPSWDAASEPLQYIPVTAIRFSQATFSKHAKFGNGTTFRYFHNRKDTQKEMQGATRLGILASDVSI